MLRQWIDLIENECLDEGRVHHATVDDPRRAFSVDVVENPSVAQLKSLLARWSEPTGRFILDGDGNLWVWARSKAIHFDIMSALGIADEDIGGYIGNGEIGIRHDYDGRLADVGYRLRQSDAVLRAMGGPSFKIYRSTESSSSDW
jgi:hypothetical protein